MNKEIEKDKKIIEILKSITEDIKNCLKGDEKK